jgi:hypothetical protein
VASSPERARDAARARLGPVVDDLRSRLVT